MVRFWSSFPLGFRAHKRHKFPRKSESYARHNTRVKLVKKRGRKQESVATNYWLYGQHPVRAALDNPRRSMGRLLATRNAARNLGPTPIEPEIVERKTIDRLVPGDAVHQGIALDVSPLPDMDLDELLADGTTTSIVVLDQVTDPHNVGAVLRSAAAFGASAVVTTWRHSPPETAVLAKSSAGALEAIPYIRGHNLAEMMRTMQNAGYLIIGLDAHAEQAITELPRPDRFALVLGAEGKGLRQLTTGLCDTLVRLPISDRVDSLNVSNAAAVALYALTLV